MPHEPLPDSAQDESIVLLVPESAWQQEPQAGEAQPRRGAERMHAWRDTDSKGLFVVPKDHWKQKNLQCSLWAMNAPTSRAAKVPLPSRQRTWQVRTHCSMAVSISLVLATSRPSVHTTLRFRLRIASVLLCLFISSTGLMSPSGRLLC